MAVFERVWQLVRSVAGLAALLLAAPLILVSGALLWLSRAAWPSSTDAEARVLRSVAVATMAVSAAILAWTLGQLATRLLYP